MTECMRERAHHQAINSIVRISLDNRFLDAFPVRSAPINTTSPKCSADLAQLKFNPQRDALFARELGIGPAGRVSGGENAHELRRARARDTAGQARFHFSEEGLGDRVCFEKDAFGGRCRRRVRACVCHRRRSRDSLSKNRNDRREDFNRDMR